MTKQNITNIRNKVFTNTQGEKASFKYIINQKVTSISIGCRIFEKEQDIEDLNFFSKLFKGNTPKVIKNIKLKMDASKKFILTYDPHMGIVSVEFFEKKIYELLSNMNVHNSDFVLKNKTGTLRGYTCSLPASSIVEIDWDTDHKDISQ